MVLAFTLLALLTAGMMVIAAFRVLPARRTAASTALGIFFVAAMLWCMAHIAEISSAAHERVFWGSVKFVAIQAVGPTWLAHALIYRRPDGRTPWLPVIAASLPNLVVPILLVSPATTYLVRVYSVETGKVNAGPVFWYNMAYQMALILVASVVALRALQQNRFTARRVTRLWVLTFTVCLPVVGNVIHVFKLIPSVNVDPTPMLVCAASPLMLWAMAPAGANMQAYITDEIVRAYPYPTVLVDASGRVESMSLVAERIFGDRFAVAGMPIADLMPGYPLLAPSGPIPLVATQAEVILSDGPRLRHWVVDRTVIRNANDQVVAHVYVFGAVPQLPSSPESCVPQPGSHLGAGTSVASGASHNVVIHPDLADAVAVVWPENSDPNLSGFCRVTPVAADQWMFFAGATELSGTAGDKLVAELAQVAVALRHSGQGSAQIAAELNLLVSNYPDSPYTQVWLGFATRSGGSVQMDYTLAGVEPLFTMGSAGAAADVATLGPALGVLAVAQFPSFQVTYAQTAVVVSTGLAAGEQLLADGGRVAAVTCADGTESVQQVAHIVGDVVTARSGSCGPVVVFAPGAVIDVHAEVS